jgi:hypothetical protein
MNSLRALARGVAKKRMKKAGIVKVNRAMSHLGSNGEALWRSFVKPGTRA